jgi:hypothetical protein
MGKTGTTLLLVEGDVVCIGDAAVLCPPNSYHALMQRMIQQKMV